MTFNTLLMIFVSCCLHDNDYDVQTTVPPPHAAMIKLSYVMFNAVHILPVKRFTGIHRALASSYLYRV